VAPLVSPLPLAPSRLLPTAPPGCTTCPVSHCRWICDWQSGTLASETCEAYRPPPWLERRVKSRDGTCRFFGCTVAASRCDVDHVVSHPRGPTDVANLMCLCRHHHRLKQQDRWRVSMTPDGVVTWTTPVGDQFTTWPVDHLGVRDLAS
jgi:hypothetical protein